MPRVRTLPKAVEEVKKKDPGTCVTLARLRRWVKEGKIVSVYSGTTALVDVDALEAFVSGGGVAHADR